MGALMGALFAVTSVGACAESMSRSEGLVVTTLPEGVRGDYELFAQRCSKCHSLARPLGSGIDDDEYWRRYVERMRRMPSSGISVEDVPPILRFLSYYSTDLRNKKAEREAPKGTP